MDLMTVTLVQCLTNMHGTSEASKIHGIAESGHQKSARHKVMWKRESRERGLAAQNQDLRSFHKQ
jgi:hypothetical protein